MAIAANLEFFQEYEMIERDDFQEVYAESKKIEQSEQDIKIDPRKGEKQ